MVETTLDIVQNQVAASFSLRYLACNARRMRSEQAAVDAGFSPRTLTQAKACGYQVNEHCEQACDVIKIKKTASSKSQMFSSPA